MAPTRDPDVHAVVSARSIIWLGDLSEQQKAGPAANSDVINSTLLAQLAANTPHDANHADEWYKKYIDVLSQVGWVVQGHQFSAVDYNKASGSVDDTVITTLRDDPEIANLLRILARSGKESSANQVLNASSITSENGFASFQLIIASSDHGNLMLKLYAFTYSSSLKIDHALWFQWKNATLHFQTSTLTMILNEDVYSMVRERVEEKLAGRKRVVIDLK